MSGLLCTIKEKKIGEGFFFLNDCTTKFQKQRNVVTKIASKYIKCCATAMLSWLDCGTSWFQASNLIQMNLIVHPKQNTSQFMYE